MQTGISGDTKGGDGTYCNPRDFAIGTDQDGVIVNGIRIYIKDPKGVLSGYYARNDSCASCTGLHFDLYTGGDASYDGQKQITCEETLSPPDSSVTLYPPSGLTVDHPGPIFNGSCPE
jgi:hypothetical protein